MPSLLPLQGGIPMNINRTFSIPVATAVKLKGERNQSRTVTKAVNKYLKEKSEFDLTDATTRSLMAVISNRVDTPEYIKVIIREHLRTN